MSTIGEEAITRRRYLLTKALQVPGTSWMVAVEAVASTWMEHPEWDMDEEHTWEEWERSGG